MTDGRPRPVKLRPSWTRIAFFAALGPIILAMIALWIDSESKRGAMMRTEFRQSIEYQRELAQLFSLLKDAETGERGYLLTGDRSFLEPYERGTRYTPAQLRDVEAVARKPDAPDLAQLNRLIDAKFDHMRRMIEIYDRAGTTMANAKVREGQGKDIMDQIRTLMAQMDQRSEQRLATSLRHEEDRVSRVRHFIWATIAIAAFAAGLVGFIVGRDRRLQHLLTIERQNAAARQRAIFESATDAIILINPSGSIETINPAAEKMFGYNAADLLRRDISTLVDIAPGEGNFLSRLGVRDGELRRPEIIDVTGRTSRGEAVPVDISLGTMPLPDGIHIVAALRDATARREVERLKDDFISTVSHELRTPLTSVVGSLGLLRSGAAGQLPDDAQRLADIAENNSQRLIRLINDILDMDQIRKGRMAFDYAVVDLRDVVTKTVQTMQGLADRRSVKLDVVLPNQPAMACADLDRLIQVAGNLVSNAVKFSPEGSAVRFELIRGEDDHVVQVTDSGPGISPEFARNIFNRFSQAERPAGQKIGGTGLGLAISREIVRNHGGDVSFENRPEGGAVFAFSIPRDTAVEAGDDASRLLVCLEDVETGQAVQTILTAHGYASDLVMTVRDAIAHARTRDYHAILLDGAMAAPESYELLRRLNKGKTDNRSPIVVVADTLAPVDLDEHLYAAWLLKPLDPPRLVQLVQRAIRRADQRKAVILHVDDDDDTRELFATALAGRGLLLNAHSLASAARILAERRPDAIVLDLGLPDGSGRSLLSDVKGWNEPLPVIVYSAQEIDDDIRQSADAVLVKSRRALPKLAMTVLDIVDRNGGPQ